jgi:hypothetical protein
MKCPTCTNKPIVWGLGFCKKCSASVPSSGYKYCDACSQQLQQCQTCGQGVGTSASSAPAQPSGPSPFITKVSAKDAGKTLTGIRTGEHVEITLDEDQYAGKEWGIKSNGWRTTRISSGAFTQNPQNPQFGTRSFVFSCDSAGTVDIELHEVQRHYNYGWGFGGGRGTSPVPGGKTFTVTLDIS